MDYYAALERSITQLLVRKWRLDGAAARDLTNDILRTISLVQANSEEAIFPHKGYSAGQPTTVR